MVAWLGDYYRLVAIHRPLGIMILILCRHSVCKTDAHDAAAVPTHHVPSGTIPGFVIREVALRLMFAQPLVAWGMLSAGHYPIVMFGPVHLPPILPAIRRSSRLLKNPVVSCGD
jgi:cytochrome b561